jgi:hypothetical protein
MKKLIPIESANATHLEVKVEYNLGGMNYFSYQNEARGYYASVSPVTVGEHTISYSAFSGVKVLLLEVKKRSKKSEEKAVALFTPELEQQLSDRVLGKDRQKAARLQIERELNVSIPPRYDGLSLEQVSALPVKVVLDGGVKTYANLEEAKANHDLSKLCGAMHDRINGIDGLRFESPEVARVLSQ